MVVVVIFDKKTGSIVEVRDTTEEAKEYIADKENLGYAVYTE